jgi:hypothetical protein
VDRIREKRVVSAGEEKCRFRLLAGQPGNDSITSQWGPVTRPGGDGYDARILGIPKIGFYFDCSLYLWGVIVMMGHYLFLVRDWRIRPKMHW